MSPHWVNAPHQELAPITEMSTSCFKKGKILFLFSSNPPGLHLPVLHFSLDVEVEVTGFHLAIGGGCAWCADDGDGDGDGFGDDDSVC